MNLMFTLDSNYITQLRYCLLSIIRFPVSEGYDVYILVQERTLEFDRLKEEFEKNENVRIHLLEVNETLFASFPEIARYTRVVYYRIFAASILPSNMDRVLYLDPDIIVIKPLDELYNMDFNGNYYIACSHTKEILTEINRVRLGIKNNVPYINTGVMVMNLELLRKEQTTKEIIEYVNKHGKSFILPDQDVITAVYGEKVKLADTMKYNLSDRLITMNNLNIIENEFIDMDWVKKNAVIIHYYGDNKPWKENYRGILNVFYNEIAENSITECVD
ncbi:MAG: glycosyltransferase family 8 protein [Clostridiales bacterium]|nr:glycosyltransferase family 8 protein [Clostridiales bacterium]